MKGAAPGKPAYKPVPQQLRQSEQTLIRGLGNGGGALLNKNANNNDNGPPKQNIIVGESTDTLNLTQYSQMQYGNEP